MAVQQNKVSKSRRNNRRSHGHYASREVVASTTEIDLDDDAA